MTLYGSNREAIGHAADVWRRGGLVAFPTETVYGLGADASNERAVMSIFSAKGRPADHPLIVHLAAAEDMERWARDIPDVAWILAQQFWPGPLTLILKRAPGVLDVVTGGQDTIGLRVPNHPLALALLNAFGGGIAAPSANRFGRVSPTCAAHVISEFGNTLDCIIDGGCCELGLESTILDLSAADPRILRPGSVMPNALTQTLALAFNTNTNTNTDADAVPRVPGSLASHYAPDTALRLLDKSEIQAAAQSFLQQGQSVAVMSMHAPEINEAGCRWLTMPANPGLYGHQLYARLREIDTWACQCILVELPPAQMQWEAVHDRLKRAAGDRVLIAPVRG